MALGQTEGGNKILKISKYSFGKPKQLNRTKSSIKKCEQRNNIKKEKENEENEEKHLIFYNDVHPEQCTVVTRGLMGIVYGGIRRR